MAVKDILIWPHPKLKNKSDIATFGDVRLPQLFQDLKDTVFMAGGLGLSAIQIGVPLRVMVAHFAKRPEVWINPIWKPLRAQKVLDEEGCLSLPDIYERVSRFQSIVVRGFDEGGQEMMREFHDYQARVFQHEIDHFNGLIYPDRMDPGARDRIRKQLRGRKAA